MKFLFCLSFLILCPFLTNAQKVFSVNFVSQADVKVYVVKYESQADLKVFKLKYASQADLKIFFVDYESKAGWRNYAKKSLMY